MREGSAQSGGQMLREGLSHLWRHFGELTAQRAIRRFDRGEQRTSECVLARDFEEIRDGRRRAARRGAIVVASFVVVRSLPGCQGGAGRAARSLPDDGNGVTVTKRPIGRPSTRGRALVRSAPGSISSCEERA